MGVRPLLHAWVTKSHFYSPGPSLSPWLPPVTWPDPVSETSSKNHWALSLFQVEEELFSHALGKLLPASSVTQCSFQQLFSGSAMLQKLSPPALGSASTETPDSSLSAGAPLKPWRELPSKTPSFPPAQDSKRVGEDLDPLHICKTQGCYTCVAQWGWGG